MSIRDLQTFYLVGGTCLSLRYGHRKSVDLDFFATSDVDLNSVVTILEKNFPGFVYRNRGNTVGIFGYIDDVKVDFVKHHFFKVIDKPIVEDEIRMYSDRDIIAMKVFAILKRAEKKDFWDMAELLKSYTIQDVISAYDEKYPNHQLPISIPQAITYFVDAEESEDPVSLKETWSSVKEIIQNKVKDYLR